MPISHRIASVIVAALGGAAYVWAEPVADYSTSIPKGVPAGAEIHLAADQPTFYLGENILLHYEVKNSGNEPIVVDWGGDYRGSPRLTRVRVIATDEAGQMVKDPTPDPRNLGGFCGRESIKPGGIFYSSVPVMRYCLFDKPGKYTIRVAHDLGWGGGDRGYGKIPNDDTRWASAEIELVMPGPDEAEQIVETMLRLPDQAGSMGEKQTPYVDFTCLRYPVFLPLLQRLIDKGDMRAFGGVALIPTVEATRAIVACLADNDEKVVDAAVSALGRRLPHPSLTDPPARQQGWSEGQRQRQLEMANQTWRDEFAEPIMVYARKALDATPRNGMRDNRMEAAADLAESVAQPEDMPTVVKALDRMLRRSQEVTVETPLIHGIIPNLQWAAAGILSRGGKAPQKPLSPGEIAVYLEALRNSVHIKGQSDKEDKEHGPALSPEFDAYARRWMEHPIAYVQRLAIENLSTPCPEWAIEPLRHRLFARDVGVQYAAVNTVGKTGDASFGPTLLELVRKSDDQWVVPSASDAATDVGVTRDQVLLAWAERLDRPDFENNFRTMNQLVSLIEHQGSGGNGNGPQPTSDERAGLKARWIAFIGRHSEAIRAGRVFKVDDPEIACDLIPSYFDIGVGGKRWPPP
ncbi:hypothetical protein Pla108_20520 [Botrimarina colliarenosi]|uniref:Uncharacterized protein n=1 Tax=Botrimarina colliarenosi TaxID=2528001 RepID=A0A5C6AF02_9BACT|nr:HEAT repeat domain-containing protein [Botrimarina colliarenosi]TWT97898.1 hypothetical protein Pla108_20520 [Botrimarina colliarenosi]